MSNALKIAAGVGGSVTPLYVDDVFSTYLYTGNGVNQTINNGIDLAGNGGMVWCKSRISTTLYNCLMDTNRGTNSALFSNSPQGVWGGYTVTSFNNNGFTLGSAGDVNQGGGTFVSWTFRKAPKFFDVVAYTGNGVAGRAIPHALGQVPGMIIVKCTTSNTGWAVYHRSQGATKYGLLNAVDTFAAASSMWNDTTPTSTVFSVGNSGATNVASNDFVAYLFAHDPSADGIIQCGSFTTDGSGNATVNLGWEPQYFLVKAAGIAQNWFVVDVARDMSHTSNSTLYPNLSNAEALVNNNGYVPTATGLQINGALSAVQSYIYLAIRRPNKPPTTGTQVYNAIARTGTGAAATVTGVGFAPDLVIGTSKNIAGLDHPIVDRLRGPTKQSYVSSTDTEVTASNEVTAFGMDGFTLGTGNPFGYWNASPWPFINWFFKRAPGVFDVVCYTGTGVSKTEAHNLGVVPELIIRKSRSTTNNWDVWCSYAANTANGSAYLNNTDAYWPLNGQFQTLPTSSSFTCINALQNIASQTYVAYLFATKAGISKVGSYTGNGTSQTINCGFTTGARFILIKRTDSAGDWFVWDSVRGIVAANDPHLSLNTTAAEVTTDDSVDPDSTGFIVNQVAATNINVTSATYIFLAFA